MKKLIIGISIFLLFLMVFFYYSGAPVEGKKQSTDFIEGWFAFSTYQDLELLKSQDYNVVLFYSDDFTDEQVSQAINKAGKLGLKVIMQIRRVDLEQKNYDKISAFIRRYKNHPALFAWYLIDEPDLRINDIPPNVAKNVYNMLKAATPHKDVYHCFSPKVDEESFEKFKDSCDVLMLDYYPRRHNAAEFAAPHFDTFKDQVEKCYEFVQIGKKKGYIFVLQGVGIREDGTPHDGVFGDPTYKEYRYMAYTNLIRKCIGLIPWIIDWSNEKITNKVIQRVREEYQELLPAVKNGEYMSDNVIVSNKDISYLYSSGDKLLIAVNDFRSSEKVEFKIKNTSLPSRIREIFDNRELRTRGNSFSDEFEPFQVHVYRWN